MGDLETYTRLERDSFGVERMVTYNSAGEVVVIADPVLDDEGRVRFVPRPDLSESSSAATAAEEPASAADAKTSAAPGPPSATVAPAVEPWWSNPKNTPALVIASICAGAIIFLGLSLVYRMITNPAKPEYSGVTGSGSAPRGNPYSREDSAPMPSPQEPYDMGRESYPPVPNDPVPTDPVPIDPNAGPTPGDLGPTDPAMNPNVTDPALNPADPTPEEVKKPTESAKKPIDLRGDDEDTGASSPPSVTDPKKESDSKGKETKSGSGPDLRGGSGE